MRIDVRTPGVKLISLRQACEILGVSKSTIHRYRRCGLRTVKVGGTFKTTMDALQEFLEDTNVDIPTATSRNVSGLSRHGLD